MRGMSFDDSEVRALVDHIDTIAPKVIKDAEAVMRRGALEMKKTFQAEAKTSRHFHQIAPAISYDVTTRTTGMEIELGPDKDRGTNSGRPGPLANIAYFGGANGGGGSLDFDGPVEREVDQIDRYLSDVIGDAL